MKMKSAVIAVFSVAVLTQTVWPGGGPKIEIKERGWDFGAVPLRAKVAHRFGVRNIGTDTLKIAKVRATCQCTTSPLKKKALGPGESTWIEITFDSKNEAGPVTTEAFVESNDPVDTLVELKISANVAAWEDKGLLLDPLRAEFDTVRTLPARVSLKIKNFGKTPVVLKVLEAPPSHLSVNLPKAPVPPGGVAEIEVVLKSPVKKGEFLSSFTLVRHSSPEKRFSVPIRGVYRPAK
jgi:hypothetical protein